MRLIASLCLLGAAVSFSAEAQTATLTSTGNITATAVQNNYSYTVNGSGSATLTGYGNAKLSITGTYSLQDLTAPLTLALDFGGGNVLSGRFSVPAYFFDTNISTSDSVTFVPEHGSGRFADETGLLPGVITSSMHCKTPIRPCPDVISGAFSLSGTGLLSVQGNRAALSFSLSEISVAGGQGADQVIVADLNRDGKPDLVVYSISAGILTVLLGNGDGTFQSHAYSNLGPNPHYVAVADLNGDSKLDILIADYNDILFTMLGNGDGSFQNPKLAAQTGSCCRVAVGDWNGDKKLDVAIASSPNFLALGNGDGTFGPRSLVRPGFYAVGSGIVAADVNGDGKSDLIIANYSDDQLSVLLGNGDGTFQSPRNMQLNGSPSGAIASADLNGDGKPDVVFTEGSNADVVLGFGDGTFRTSVVLPNLDTVLPFSGVALADMDRDGKLDLVTTTFNGIVGSGLVNIYLGLKDGTFLVPVTFALNNTPTSIAVADLNLDGKPDVISTSLTGAGVTILLNTSVITSVSGPPVLRTNPANQTARVGEIVTFTASALGAPIPAARWQVSADDGVTFTDVPAATSSNYSFTASGSQNENRYRAVFTNNSGSVTSTAATLSVVFLNLNIQKTHLGDLALGQQGGTYEITVSNDNGSGPTRGTVTVTENVPAGLVLVSMNGSGWTCPGTAANNCTRTDALNAGASYPPITVTVDVTANATSPQVNRAYVWGGGSGSFGVADSTAIFGGAPAGMGFFPLAPCRMVDTRTSQSKNGAFGPPSLLAYTGRDFNPTMSGCGILSAAQAYSLNFTVVPSGPLDFLSTWPAGQPYLSVSTLNSPDGRTIANAAIVPAGTNGAISVITGQSTDLVIDVNGYFASPNGQELAFYLVNPCRVVDTRSGQGNSGQFGPPALPAYNGGRAFPIPASACNIPNTAKAYSLNLTVVPQGPLSFLSIWPADQPYPGVSTLNSNDGSIIANAAIVPAATNGDVQVVTGNSTDFIMDINGYFAAPGGTGALHFYALTPCRVADTRTSQPFSGPFGPPALGAYSQRDIPIQASTCGIPATAQAYSLNFTAVPHGPLSFLSVWPAGQPYPTVSTLNSPDGTILADAAIVSAGTNGSISVLSGNATDLIIDINGYFAP